MTWEVKQNLQGSGGKQNLQQSGSKYLTIS